MRRINLPLIISFVVIGALIAWYLLRPSGPQQFRWFEMFQTKSRQPYGLYIINRLLASAEKYTEISKPLSKTLNKDDTSSCYVFIGQTLYTNTDDEKALLSFVERGNTAFISSESAPSVLKGIMKQSFNAEMPVFYNYVEKAEVKMNFYHHALTDSSRFVFGYMIKDMPADYTWRLIDANYFRDTADNLTPLGFMNDGYVNFFKISHGRGEFYIHTAPVVFTNYFMNRDVGKAYADRVFTHFPQGHIYWDELSKYPFNAKEEGRPGYNPFAYILSQHILRNTLYMLFVLAALYLLFVARRRQRVIPVLNSPSNTSLEYLGTIGRLYQGNPDYREMADKKMRYFLSHIRQRYGLSTAETDEDFRRKLSQRSGVPYEQVDEIFTQYGFIRKYTEVYADQVWDFSKLLYAFYEKSKK